MREHISYSELKTWTECAYKHKLSYIDDVRNFVGNEYTAFGKAIHDTCEQALLADGPIDNKNFFDHKFLHEIQELVTSGVELNTSLLGDMRKQAEQILKHVLPGLKEYFSDYEVVSTEEKLYVPISEDYNFKGYIDLVLKTSDGKYHIIDWKTCSWGWDSRKKADSMLAYQLTLYKNFFAKKHNIDPTNIDTHFALLKRTAKKNRVEIFKVTSGAKKTENCLKLLNKAIYNIKNERYIKNRLSCTQGFGCEFYNTKHCSR
mgnify:CR=1 FL=1